MSSHRDSLTEQVENDFCHYQVKPGDSLSSIAAHFGYVTPTQLGKINSLPFSGCSLPHIFPGQKLIIPTVSKSSVVTPNARRAPGTALRVRAASEIVKSTIHEHNLPKCFQLQDIYTVTRGHPQVPVSASEAQDVDDTSARKFVKIPAKHLYSTSRTDEHDKSTELIDGVLLITPDLLCFDATTTAQAQKQAFVNKDLEFADANSEQVDLDKDHTPELIQRKTSSLKLGGCVPLSQITSMSTMKSVHDIYQVLQMTNPDALSLPDSLPSDPIARPSDEHVSVETLDESNSVLGDQQTKDDAVSPLLTVDIRETVPVVANRQVQDDSVTERNDRTRPCSSDADDVFVADAAIVEQGAPDSSGSLGVQKFVYLWLTASEGVDSTKEYIYQIPTDEITDVYNFLFRAGVGQAHRKISSLSVKAIDHAVGVQRQHTMSESSTELINSTSKVNDCSSARRSMVEEMLQSIEDSSPMPLLYGGKSTILADEMLEELGSNMPVHWIGSNLSLIYSTEVDGYSLATLYRKSNDIDGGVLLVIRDTMGTVFGAIMSERMHCSQHFYGTGESCVFHWLPEFKRYDWTKKNYYFMRGSPSCFHIGGQSGRSAIWFDEALKYGRSEPTDTFNNPVLSGCLPEFHVPITAALKQENETTESTEDQHTCCELRNLASPKTVESVPFIIDSLEVWELVS